MISMLMMLILMLIMMMIMMSTTAGASTWNPICPWHRLSLKPTKLEAYGLWGEAYVPFPAFFPPTSDPTPVPLPPVPSNPDPGLASCVHLSPAMLKVQGVCDGLESKPHGGKRLPFSPRVYRMGRVPNRGMARVNKGMARQINLKNRDKGNQKNPKHIKDKFRKEVR